MKTFSTLLIALFLTFTSQAQLILIVDNTSSAPEGDHVYSDISTALGNAQEGDIIQLVPSSTSYGDVTIDGLTGITIIGVGLNPGLISNNITEKSELGVLNILDGENIIIKGTSISRLTLGSSTDDSKVPSNIYISETVVTDKFQILDATSIIITKSSLRETTIQGQVDQIIISNSIVRGRSNGLENTLFINNIITNTESHLMNTSVIRNCTFENNVFWDLTALFNFGRNNSASSVYLNNIATFPMPDYGTNSSEGNIVSTTNPNDWFIDDRVVTNSGNTSGFWEVFWDVAVEAEELKNAGTDGSDLGPAGGVNPYIVDSSPIPVITALQVPNVIKLGTEAELRIKAKGN